MVSTLTTNIPQNAVDSCCQIPFRNFFQEKRREMSVANSQKKTTLQIREKECGFCILQIIHVHVCVCLCEK